MNRRNWMTTVGIGALTMGCLLAESAAQTGLRLASPFTDHAVLQRDMPVPVWGTADPGTEVTVTFAGQQNDATADAAGRWRVVLDPIPASAEGRELRVVSGRGSAKGDLRCADVVVGEVWICSGQSNMQFSANAVPEVKALVPRQTGLRCFDVKKTVAFGEQDFCEGKWTTRGPDSAVAFGFAYFLEEAAAVPVGIILACWGSSSIEAWMPRDMTAAVPHFKTLMQEFDADSATRGRIESILNGPRPWSRPDDIFLRRQPNILYNAMMSPLAPYACRGLVWYQGERNTQSMFGMVPQPWFSRNSGMLKYGDTLQAWMKRYRKKWARDDFHFLIVMLPGCHAKQLKTGPPGDAESVTAHSWAWMRESQLKALALPHAGVTNTIDLGDVKNVHPKDKLPIGERLALLAARDTLGHEVEADGPVMDRVGRRDDRLVVHFRHADGLTTRDGQAPKAFWLADDSKRWVRADAQLEGTSVVLRSPQVAKPLYVRYAFAGKPSVNLVNGAGLPAYPFRTDTFAP